MTVLLLTSGSLLFSQSTSSSSLTTGAVLSNAWNAFSGGKPVHSIQISGNASSQLGPDSQSGSISATAATDSTISLQRTTGTGVATEIKASTNGVFQCAWTSADGIQHAIPQHNCWQPVPWFAPFLATEYGLTPTNLGVTYIGHETLGSQGVEHLQFQTVVGNAQTPANFTTLVQAASTADLYLDSSTFLPVVLRYPTHPDQDANTIISIEVRYSAYSQLSGLTIPTHIERAVNGNVQDVVDINSALSN
ncbi:hypothetical protein [Candidatus Korobacter versatilis]|nr:hypothetical protein [Candidatus Koribacter versatilis]